MSEIVRVVRILEYTGPRASVEKVLQQNAVKGFKDFGVVVIREAVLPFPEVVEASPVAAEEAFKAGYTAGWQDAKAGKGSFRDGRWDEFEPSEMAKDLS